MSLPQFLKAVGCKRRDGSTELERFAELWWAAMALQRQGAAFAASVVATKVDAMTPAMHRAQEWQRRCAAVWSPSGE